MENDEMLRMFWRQAAVCYRFYSSEHDDIVKYNLNDKWLEVFWFNQLFFWLSKAKDRVRELHLRETGEELVEDIYS